MYKMKKLSIILVIAMCLSLFFSVSVFAASKTAINWHGVKTYATKSIQVYKNTKTTTSSGTIYNGDCITIKSYDDSSKRFNVTYPVTNGKSKGATATGYIKASVIGYNLSNYPNKTWNIAYGFDVKGYTRSSIFNKSLTFSEGTTICEFGGSGDYISVVGKVSGTYYLVYVKKSDVRKVPSMSTSKTYKITSKLNSNYVLDVDNGSKENGANIQLYKWNGTSAQVFKFNESGNKYYRITNYNSNKEVARKEANVVQWSCADVWSIAEDNNGYIIIVPASNKNICMDVTGGKVANRTNIQLYKINNTDSQRFKLVEVKK